MHFKRKKFTKNKNIKNIFFNFNNFSINDVKNMSLKKRIIEQLNPNNYSYSELIKMTENLSVFIFIISILLTIFFFIFLILLILSLWQIFITGPLLIEWNVLGVFISILLGIISVLLGALSVFLSQIKEIEEVIGPKDEKND